MHKHPKRFLESVCRGELTSEIIDRPKFKGVAIEIEASDRSREIRDSLLEMLLMLSRYDELVFGTVSGGGNTPFVRGLIKLHDRKALWLRPLDRWRRDDRR